MLIFDQIPAPGKIRIVRRQRPDRVQMIGQNADRDRLERIAFAAGRIGAAQAIDMAYEKVARAIGESQREEEPAAFNPDSTVL